MNHALFLIAGYGITWIAVIGYLLRRAARNAMWGSHREPFRVRPTRLTKGPRAVSGRDPYSVGLYQLRLG